MISVSQASASQTNLLLEEDYGGLMATGQVLPNVKDISSVCIDRMDFSETTGVNSSNSLEGVVVIKSGDDENPEASLQVQAKLDEKASRVVKFYQKCSQKAQEFFQKLIFNRVNLLVTDDSSIDYSNFDLVKICAQGNNRHAIERLNEFVNGTVDFIDNPKLVPYPFIIKRLNAFKAVINTSLFFLMRAIARFGVLFLRIFRFLKALKSNDGTASLQGKLLLFTFTRLLLLPAQLLILLFGIFVQFFQTSLGCAIQALGHSIDLLCDKKENQCSVKRVFS